MFATRCIRLVVAFAIAVVFASTAFAQVHVRSYTRKDGTFVKAHQRSRPDGNFWNNYSTIGNINPHTGQPGTKRMPPAGYGGSSFANVARSGCSNQPNSLTPACNQSRANMFASANLSPSSSSAEASFESMYGSSLSLTQRERERKLKLAEQRRDEEKARREKSRDTIPVRIWSEEQLAQSKFKVAHMLYLGGKIDAAKNVLIKLLDEYPDSVTADRATLTLAQL